MEKASRFITMGTFIGQTGPMISHGYGTYRLNSLLKTNSDTVETVKWREETLEKMTEIEKEYVAFVNKLKQEWDRSHPENPIISVDDFKFNVLTHRVNILNPIK